MFGRILIVGCLSATCLLVGTDNSRPGTKSPKQLASAPLNLASSKKLPLGNSKTRLSLSGAVALNRDDDATVEAAQRESSFVAPIALPIVSNRNQVRSRATSHPHGKQLCASGCAVSRHPTQLLTKKRFLELCKQYRADEPGVDSESLDSLIFYGSQTVRHLKMNPSALPRKHFAFLSQQLDLSQLIVELRVIEEGGRVRVSLPPTKVPQHIRQEFAMDVADLNTTITSGTLKRVGLNHVWQRL